MVDTQVTVQPVINDIKIKRKGIMTTVIVSIQIQDTQTGYKNEEQDNV